MSKRKREPSEDFVLQVRAAIQDLKPKSHAKIAALTCLAKHHYNFAENVSQILAEEISGAETSRLPALFSAMDSILKKVGNDYKNHLARRMPDICIIAFSKADETLRGWLRKMVSESWKTYELLPEPVLQRLDSICTMQQLPQQPVQPPLLQAPPTAAGPSGGFTAQAAATGAAMPATVAAPAAGAVTGQQPFADVTAVARPMVSAQVAPPAAPRPPVVEAHAAATRAAAVKPANPAADKAPLPALIAESAEPATSSRCRQAAGKELVERQLMILTKMIARKKPEPSELQDIMKVPEIKTAREMNRQGKRTEAMALLSRFKEELERQCREYGPADPRQQAPPVEPGQAADPRRVDAKLADPRQLERHDAKAMDRHLAKHLESKRIAGVTEHPHQAGGAAAEKAAAAGGSATSENATADNDNDRLQNGKVNGGGRTPAGFAPARKILQGSPSIGFSETWLRQFMEQMPKGKQERDVKAEDVQSVGRRVLGASGEQMVYIDEISPDEIMLLMQFIFLLEERLRRTGGSTDMAQRIPHTFGYVQIEPAIDVMLKRFFDELPFQCPSTGLRFASREKLRKHHDVLYGRRALQQQSRRGAEARGWIESIPEWLGNRDFVVGPALFKLGALIEEGASGASDMTKAQDGFPRSNMAPPVDGGGGAAFDAEDDGGEALRWICPLDERRAVCPISGEPFERTWSPALNDWAFSGVVAVEMGTSKPLRFPARPGGALASALGPRGLSETAVLFKKSCFFNTTISRQLAALQECRAPPSVQPLLAHAGPGGGSSAGSGVDDAAAAVREDPELVMLATAKRTPRPFF